MKKIIIISMFIMGLLSINSDASQMVNGEIVNFTDVPIPDSQPAFPFVHAGKEYRIWVWLDEGGPEVYTAALAEVRFTPSGDGAFLYNVLTESAYFQKVESEGGVKAFMKNNFLPKVNQYLGVTNEPTDPNYPIDDEHYLQFNWIIENALTYVDGRVIMADF